MEELKLSKVTSNDTSLLIYIPKAIEKALKLRKGTYVRLSTEGNKLVVTPLELKEETKP